MHSSYLPSQPAQGRPPVLYNPSSFILDGPPNSTSHESSLNPASRSPDKPSNGLKISHLLYNSTSAAPASTSSSLSHSYPKSQPFPRPSSGHGQPGPSLITGTRHPQDQVAEAINIPLGNISGPSQPHKRAYRQRRKDPSCDACRERKVKCDASESSSCTECSNRNVRCLFTKETNRRMSSIKQVQDLERQLAQVKQQLHQLRLGGPKYEDHDSGVHEGHSGIPEIGCRPQRINTPIARHNYSGVCSQMRLHGQGLINFPLIPSYIRSQSTVTSDFPSLPPKSVTDALLRHYFTSIHSVFPLFHWPVLLDDYDRIYHAGSFRGVSRPWASAFFAILACGSLHSLDSGLISKGKEFIQASFNLTDLWQDAFAVDSARAGMLISLFLYEHNLKSASWVWLGCAVRIAQDLGLHVESGSWTPLEAEMRRRIWWSLYAWERVVVLELGRPLLIHDEDCDAQLPSPIEEHLISDGASSAEHRTTPLLAIIHVLRSVSQLARTLRSQIILPETLDRFERHFRMCLSTFPVEYGVNSNQYLDPELLSPIIYLQNTRLVLHRHNLSPSSSLEMRRNALDQCLAIARDTTRILTRSMRSPSSDPGPGNGEWRYLLAEAASTVLCTHIWRCILLLLFNAEYSAALVCIQASAAIGNVRSANNAAGHYISFFLKCLLERQQRGEMNLESDEEMIAYVSGDLQARVDGSWVWQNSETLSPLTDTPPPTTSPSSNASPVGSRFMDHPRSESSRKEDPEQDWEGWDWIEQTIQVLMSKQQSAIANIGIQRRPSVQPEPERTLDNIGVSRSNPASSSKMTIASII